MTRPVRSATAAPRISACRLIEFPVIRDPRGNLTFVEGANHVDFDMRRVFYLYDVPGGESRAGHALKSTTQVIIAISGSFDVVVDDSHDRKTVTLNRSYVGLYLPPLVWRELENFSSGAVCLVLASRVYDEDDYVRDYEGFTVAARAGEVAAR
jgi:dTDP-4-dehydrorhamnose 3,5-epimerase-like enzyme